MFEIPAIRRKVDETTQSLKSFGHWSERGLSLLVQQCLGLPLDKTYQLSDWEQRPLLAKQVEYAGTTVNSLVLVEGGGGVSCEGRPSTGVSQHSLSLYPHRAS